MQERPKIKIPLKSIDIVLELVGWCALMAIWIFTFINYSKLPDIIPMHYNMAGEADGFGRKANIYPPSGGHRPLYRNVCISPISTYLQLSHPHHSG